MNDENILSLRILDVLAVVKTDIKKGVVAENRSRKTSAFAYKTAGKTVYNQNGSTILSDPFRIVFLPKGADYSYTVEEAGECILFELDLGEELPFDRVISFPIRSSPEVLSSAAKAERFWTYKKHGYRNKCMSCIYNILSNVNTDGNYVNSTKYDIIRPSIKYLEEHLDDPDINTDFLASLSGISVPYFRKIFNNIYKMPVAKYIESVRIGKARELLKNDYDSVGDVAECVGYRNIYHFSKAFKKVIGMSPTEYARGKI